MIAVTDVPVILIRESSKMLVFSDSILASSETHVRFSFCNELMFLVHYQVEDKYLVPCAACSMRLFQDFKKTDFLQKKNAGKKNVMCATSCVRVQSVGVEYPRQKQIVFELSFCWPEYELV